MWGRLLEGLDSVPLSGSAPASAISTPRRDALFDVDMLAAEANLDLNGDGGGGSSDLEGFDLEEVANAAATTTTTTTTTVTTATMSGAEEGTVAADDSDEPMDDV